MPDEQFLRHSFNILTVAWDDLIPFLDRELNLASFKLKIRMRPDTGRFPGRENA